MQKRATLLVLALLGVATYAGRDAFLIPLLDRIESHDTEIAGCIRLAEGEATLAAANGPAELTYIGPSREPRRGAIGRNSTLYVELRKLGVSAFDIDMMTRETRKSFDWRKVRAGQMFDVYASSAGDLDSLLLYTSPQDYVRVRRDLALDRFTAKVEPVPYEISYQVTHGTIENSIFASLEEQGAETSLASSLDEIFGWTIDFVSDLRRGDEYVLLYERRTYETGHTVVGNVLAARVVNQGKEFNAVRFRPTGGVFGYYNIDGSSMQKSMRRAPLKFTHVTSSFSRRRFHPVQKVYKPHYGTDYGAPRGTPVYATGAGLVVAAHYQSGNGNFVKIRHNRGYETYYLHLAGFAKGIRGGTRVTEGQLIGFVGSTGLATGPHLCYRMMRNGSWVNPRSVILPAKDPVTVRDIARFNAMRDAYMASIYDALLDGLDNRTRIVQTPVRPAAQMRAAMF
jgi:murein DD-endopeptidase MepM/ murein hydrolase activator NlpD